MEKVKSDFQQEVDSLKAALELARAEGRDNVRLAKQEAEGRAGREQVGASARAKRAQNRSSSGAGGSSEVAAEQHPPFARAKRVGVAR
jgi:hypothetical protein